MLCLTALPFNDTMLRFYGLLALPYNIILCYDATLLLFYLTLVFFLRYACTTLHFPLLRCYLATDALNATLSIILLKSSMFSRFSTISFYCL